MIVRDVSGSPLRGARVVISGPVDLEVTTDDSGTATLGTLGNGTYHVRFEREGYLPLERDVSIRNGQPSEIYAALRIAPAPPPPPPPPPPPAEPPPPPAPPAPIGPAVFLSIPNFLDKNFIRREPLKETVLGCLTDSTTRLLQLHDGIAEHTHADSDEILYIVAGEGTVRLRNESSPVAPGSLSIIPRGLPHAIERHGRNPLIVVSTVSGAPCHASPPAQTASTTQK